MSEAAALEKLATELRWLFIACGVPPEMADWGGAAPARAIVERSFPVQRWFDTAITQAPVQTRAVASTLAAAGPGLQWGQTYATGDFLDAYAWAELIGAQGPFESDTYAIGLLLLGPHTFYPPHAHPAREYYVPISGVASWFSDLEDWRSVSPGTLVHHPPNVAHAMRTGAQPLLAAYCWTGEDIQTSASILDA
jgi:quercetin dioxygenase-like cupin family protein